MFKALGLAYDVQEEKQILKREGLECSLSRRLLNILTSIHESDRNQGNMLGQDYLTSLFDLIPQQQISRHVRKVFFSANEKYAVLVTDTHAFVVMVLNDYI